MDPGAYILLPLPLIIVDLFVDTFSPSSLRLEVTLHSLIYPGKLVCLPKRPSEKRKVATVQHRIHLPSEKYQSFEDCTLVQIV
jgi:hypothetical protein